MKIGVASDHAGFALKKDVVNYLKMNGIDVIDFGADSIEASDYADYGHELAQNVIKKNVDFGIAICGSGNGINMTVNKYPEIRSALCWEEEIAQVARQHNDANICALPGRFISVTKARKIIDTFLESLYEGGRHVSRIKKITSGLKP